jgi:activating signal cointegrator complex subunit 2
MGRSEQRVIRTVSRVGERMSVPINSYSDFMTATSTAFALPTYPPSTVRASLSPTQLATLNEAVSSALLTTLALPPTKRDTPASRSFLSTYAKDTASSALESLIWANQSPLVRDEHIIRKRALILAERLADSPPGLDLQTLVDLAIVYAKKHPSRLRSIFAAALKSSSTLRSDVENDLIPAFTKLLENHNLAGLYGLRKTLHCILSFLHCAPDDLVIRFEKNKDLLVSLATAYDTGLNAIAQSYGGLLVLQSTDVADDWQKLWVECKTASVDIFHIIVSNLIKKVTDTSNRGISVEADRIFDLIFTLLELPSTSLQGSNSIPLTPFLNQSLLSDFQHSYNLSEMLASALKQAQERDARLDILDSALGAFGVVSSIPGRDPGALKIILHSSGVAPGIDNLGRGSSRTEDKGKGKARIIYQVPEDPELDMKVTQVLDILPEQPPEYIRDLLTHPDLPYKGNCEKLIEAILEGTAPAPETIRHSENAGALQAPQNSTDEFEEYVTARRNVFDDEVLDTSKIHSGKK